MLKHAQGRSAHVRKRPMRHKRVEEMWRRLMEMDKVLLGLTVGLSLFGLLMVYNSSVVSAYRSFDNKYYFLQHQAMWWVLGMGAMAFTAMLPMEWWKRNAKTFLYVTLLLLVVALLGQKTLGAKRWISIAGFTLQPSELAKITLVTYLSTLFIKSKEPYMEFLKVTGLVLGLIMLQPDLGTTIVIAASAFAVYWVAGAPVKHFLTIGAAGIVGVVGMILVSPYRYNRLMTFLNSDQDPLGTSYHVRQILIALGSGGLWGVGLGMSRQKYAYLPEVAADSIFAVIAEEMGFIGAGLVILVMGVFVLRGFKVAANSVDPFGRLLATGLITWIGVQMLVNLSAMVILVPLTGIPLPLISYGGSSLVVTLVSVGILLGVSGEPKINKSRG